jgi:hypothetical protein
MTNDGSTVLIIYTRTVKIHLYSTLKTLIISYSSAAVADGGQWMGGISCHVHTIQLLVWDTLEDFTAILTPYVGRRQKHVTRR